MTTERTPILAFNKPTVKLVADEVEKELAALCAKYNLKFTYEGGKVDRAGSYFRMGIRFDTVKKGQDVSSGTAEPAGFGRLAQRYGLPADCYRKSGKLGVTTYTIVDFAPKNRKYPVLAEAFSRSGKRTTYKLTVDQARIILGL